MVTIKDIAKLANVSHTTVSRALNDSPLINPETKERIKALAQGLNYSPNYSARSLVLDRSYNIGLFFSTLQTGTSAGFFYESVRGVNDVIKEQYNLVVRGIDDYKSYDGITRKSFDGILVMSQSEQDQPFIEHVKAKEIPLIVMNRQVDPVKVMNMIPDDRGGAYRIVDYMIQQGHKRIAIIEGKETFKSTQARREGYKDALTQNGLAVIPEYQVRGSYSLESGYDAMKQLLSGISGELPTAVFCCNDEMALGAIKAIQESGLKVPDEISVAGFDAQLFSGYTSPALTTVRRPIDRIGREGAARLLDFIETKQTQEETIFFHTELVIRDSVKNISGGAM
ncbi:LacI family DNA-binding transcriptional regulator [Paenibacillus thalictri]|uniref:LacI family transcriptional regulator n=1 Tax=Paenibacillus thalictri TaxID=2527873 RepID=A0A4Q9DU82_9BACL|nr:LacI family DNA-binding transcriptional regulator [Paenibacillus thalictri]TBL78257.1 LacI family transcriptional regulator [Paenibacillus thalictri]